MGTKQSRQPQLPCQPTCLVSLPALSACLPCQPACLVSLPALSACLPCQPACLVSLPALSACLPCQPACLVSLPALSACLPCQSAGLVRLPALLACLPCVMPDTEECSSEWLSAVDTKSTNKTTQGRGYIPSVSPFLIEVYGLVPFFVYSLGARHSCK